MKKIYTTLAFTLLSFAAFSQAGTFDWENAAGDNTGIISQTVDGVTASFTADGGTNLRLLNGGSQGGTSGNVVLNDPNIPGPSSVTFTFTEPIDVESIIASDNNGAATGDPTWTFTPEGGNNSPITQVISDNVNGTPYMGMEIELNLVSVTSITITSSNGADFYVFDDIVFSPATVVSCDTFESQDVPGDIDPGATQTADCVDAPNFYTVALPFLGEVGTDIRIDQIMVDISHTFTGDLSLLLEDDQGNFIFLAENLGGATDDAYNGTIFQDGGADITTATAPFGAGPYAASGGNLNDVFDGVFIGDDVTWSLVICDNSGDDTGVVNEFSITFCDGEILNVINNELSQSLKLYPNPANTIVTFSTPVDSYEVYNLLGQSVFSGSEQSLDVQSLTEGMYLVKFSKDGTVGTERLIVKH